MGTWTAVLVQRDYPITAVQLAANRFSAGADPTPGHEANLAALRPLTS